MKRILSALLVAGLTGCLPSTEPPGVARGALISDQVHSGGALGFFWLPPLVAAPALEGTFDATQSPTVTITPLPLPAQPIASFTLGSGLRVDPMSQLYVVNWHTDAFALDPEVDYRIAVEVGGRTLGILDVDLLASQAQAKNVDTGELLPLLDGRTLPIKFFLNTCAAVVCQALDGCHQAGTCDPASGTCSDPVRDDGTPCDDGDACTTDDVCGDGACGGTLPATCALGACSDASGACTLTLSDDQTLTAPIVIDEGSPLRHLDCAGHQLLPSQAGVDDAHGPGGYQPSVPEIGVAVVHRRDVTIERCVIGSPDRRIDFGISLIGEPQPEPSACDASAAGNRVRANTIYVRAVGLSVLASDDNRIGGDSDGDPNTIEWNGSGIGIDLERGADCNLVQRNVLRSTGAAPTFIRPYPGSNDSGAAFDVGVYPFDVVTNPLTNVRVAGRLLQFTNVGTPHVVGNVIEENTVTMADPRPNNAGVDCGTPLTPLCKNGGGIIMPAMTKDTVVRGNTVIGGRPGIRFAGFMRITAVNFPRLCSDDPLRYCTSSADCTCPPFGGQCFRNSDGSATGVSCSSNLDCASGQTCANAIIDGRARANLSEGNTLYGPFGNAGGTNPLDSALGPFGGSVGATARNNTIYAAGTAYGMTFATSFGIAIQGDGFVDSGTQLPGSGATITGNLIDGANVGLNLRQPPTATQFGVRFWRNDVLHSVSRAVTSTGAYTLPAELSVGGQGNHWGHTCSEGGFVAGVDSNSSLIVDSNPYGARLTSGVPPALTCNGH
jgi:hypothetical protein